MSFKVPELEGKILLYQTGAYNLYTFANLANVMGMEVVGNGGHDETFASQFKTIAANAGLWCVLYPEDGQRLLAMPRDIGKKIVVFRNNAGLDKPEMHPIYEQIEREGISMLGEEWENQWYQNFSNALIKAVQA